MFVARLQELPRDGVAVPAAAVVVAIAGAVAAAIGTTVEILDGLGCSCLLLRLLYRFKTSS